MVGEQAAGRVCEGCQVPCPCGNTHLEARGHWTVSERTATEQVVLRFAYHASWGLGQPRNTAMVTRAHHHKKVHVVHVHRRETLAYRERLSALWGATSHVHVTISSSTPHPADSLRSTPAAPLLAAVRADPRDSPPWHVSTCVQRGFGSHLPLGCVCQTNKWGAPLSCTFTACTTTENRRGAEGRAEGGGSKGGRKVGWKATRQVREGR